MEESLDGRQMNMMMTLHGYHLGKTLYEGTRTQVYRSTRTTDNESVIIKFLRNKYPTFSELVQCRNPCKFNPRPRDGIHYPIADKEIKFSSI